LATTSNPLCASVRQPLRPSALKKQDCRALITSVHETLLKVRSQMAIYQNRKAGYWRIVGAIALMGGCAIANFPNRSLAQSNIVPDATLGAERSFVVPSINGLPVEAIAGGAQRGQNLFHSFEEFNVSGGRGAYFFSPNAAIQNILARVTGSNRSEILGTLGTFGNSTPNLFLINPNGIIFGRGAKLDVGGSFVATTANALRLGETGLFSASEPETTTLLAINPNALFFNQPSNQAEIVNRSRAVIPVLTGFINGLPYANGLQVREGRSLLLLGGDVRLEGGILQAPGGRVELGGLSATGTVGLNREGNTFSLSFPNGVGRADVSLTNSAVVFAAAAEGGNIAINAQTVELLGESFIFTGIETGRGSVDSRTGDIEINATGAITLSESSAIGTSVSGIGKGGDVEITTNSLSVTNGARLVANTRGRGDAGNVRITATDTVFFDGVGSNGSSSAASSSVAQGAQGKGGDVEITTNSLSVTNGAQLSASTFGRGDAGNVRITATDTVSFTGVGSDGRPNSVRSAVERGAEGKGGDIEITTNSLSVTDGTQLSASTLGRGDAGNVRIIATDTVTFAGVGGWGFSSAAGSSVESRAQGNGGDVEIITKTLSVTDGAQLIANTKGRGDAGNVRIIATDTVSFAGMSSNGPSTGAGSSVERGAEGKGGNIEITTKTLSVTAGAQLGASTFGRGDAGNVRIIATDTVSLDGAGSNGSFTGVFSPVEPGGEGKGGDIEIITNSFSVTNGAGVGVSTLGRGDAGNVRIIATDTVSFAGVGSDGRPSTAFSPVERGGEGNGGNVEIITKTLSVTDGAQLLVATWGRGDAGNVRIIASEKVSFAGVGSNGLSSGARSSVERGAEGNGGKIEITTNSLSVTDGAQLLAATRGRGDAGNVRIIANEKVSFAGIGSNRLSSGAFSSVERGAEGKGGDIEITTESLSLTDAFISSQSRGTGRAGDIIIETRQNLELNRSNIAATTQADDGGNIKLQIGDLLLLRNDSNISTTAGVAGTGGNGGNITIDADFIVAVPKEDSDITANAFNGRGGNINITTQGIYGLEFRERLTPLSDITASSQFGLNGEFQLDLLTNVDPSRGLAELPTDVVDATRQIDNRCTPAAANRRSSFVITGRGGLPPSPNEPLQGESVITNWVTLDSEEKNTNTIPKANPTSTTPKQLVEAQSWVYGANGEVILTAKAPSVTAYNSWSTSPSCDAVRKGEGVFNAEER
jgi:filamentous hemagglutinin family protein